jgi:hypothetical protein
VSDAPSLTISADLLAEIARWAHAEVDRGLTQDGHPKHPLARGRHPVPDDVQPAAWG